MVISIGTACAQDSNATENAAFVTQPPVTVQTQHVELSISFDADSLGDRSANVEATYAPFGNDKSGVRFRATGDGLVPIHSQRGSSGNS